MLLPSSEPTNTAGSSSYHHTCSKGPQYKPLTYSLKMEVACSVEIFVRISKTSRYQDTGENSLNRNKLFSIGDIKSRFEKGFPLLDAPYCLQMRKKIKPVIDINKRYNSRNYPEGREKIFIAQVRRHCA